VTDHAPDERAFEELEALFSPDGVEGLIDGTREVPDIFTDDFVLENFDEAPVPGKFEGPDGVREWARESFAPVDRGGFRYVGDPEEIAPGVYARHQIALGIGKETGIEIEWPMASIACFRDGKFAYGKGYLKYEDAVEAGRRWARENGRLGAV
jgi:hypothetical protein